jgi:hypothetical protein
MKKLKFAFWIIILGFIGLLVYQNLPFFAATNSLTIDLGIYANQTPDMTNGAIIASFVGIGVLIMLIFYFSSRYDSYRSKKTIKMLEATIEQRSGELDELKKQVAVLKGELAPEIEQPMEAEENEIAPQT